MVSYEDGATGVEYGPLASLIRQSSLPWCPPWVGGATGVEYGLLVALIAAVIVAVVVTLGNKINNAFSSVNNAITT